MRRLPTFARFPRLDYSTWTYRTDGRIRIELVWESSAWSADFAKLARGLR